MKKVMCFGTFDHLHAGHENYFKQSKKLGDYLIVVVGRDKTVQKVKGELPTNKEAKRLSIVKSSSSVNKAVFGYLKNKYQVIKKYKPNIIALGYDQFAFTYQLKKFIIDNKLDCEIVRLKSYKANIFKSSLMNN